MNYLDIARDGKNEWWRYLIGYPFIIVTWFVVGSIPLFIMIFAVGMNSPDILLNLSKMTEIQSVAFFTAEMLSFVPFIVATTLAVMVIHRRPARTLITANQKIDWKRMLAGFAVWAVLAAWMALAESQLYPGRYEFTPHPASFGFFAIIAIILTPIQTSSEEFFFRGYFLQNVGLKLKNPIVLSLISGIVFTLPHLANPEVTANALLVPLFYFSFGAFAAYISLLDNGIELALGLHAGNNLFTALFVNATVSAMPTPALFTVNEFDVAYNLISPLVGMAIFYVLMFKVWPKKMEPSPTAES